jgi:ribosomal-protein-alanine N-acetyltransferase
MIVRSWKYSDILRISQIEKECFTTEAWSFGMLATSFESDNFRGVLVDDGGEVAGYGGLTIACDTADIDNIAVSEPYRKSGVATAIVKKLCEVAKADGVEKLFLEVRVSNAAAMRLYLKCGFVGVYTRARYYPDGEDCLVMSKTL